MYIATAKICISLILSHSPITSVFGVKIILEKVVG